MTESKGITCKLRNGTEVLLSEGDRVLALRMVKDGMPITVDADYIIDEVLATLAEAQKTISDISTRLQFHDDHAGTDHQAIEQILEENKRLRKALEDARWYLTSIDGRYSPDSAAETIEKALEEVES